MTLHILKLHTSHSSQPNSPVGRTPRSSAPPVRIRSAERRTRMLLAGKGQATPSKALNSRIWQYQDTDRLSGKSLKNKLGSLGSSPKKRYTGLEKTKANFMKALSLINTYLHKPANHVPILEIALGRGTATSLTTTRGRSASKRTAVVHLIISTPFAKALKTLSAPCLENGTLSRHKSRM